MTVIADYRFEDPSSDGLATNSTATGAPDAEYRGQSHAQD